MRFSPSMRRTRRELGDKTRWIRRRMVANLVDDCAPATFFRAGNSTIDAGVQVIPRHLSHASRDDGGLPRDKGAGLVGAIDLWVRQDGRKPCGLANRKLGRRFSKIGFGGRFGPKPPRPPFNDVEISLHDPLLRPKDLYQRRQIGFDAFANPGAVLGQEKVFRGLLADRAGALKTASIGIAG